MVWSTSVTLLPSLLHRLFRHCFLYILSNVFRVSVLCGVNLLLCVPMQVLWGLITIVFVCGKLILTCCETKQFSSALHHSASSLYIIISILFWFWDTLIFALATPYPTELWAEYEIGYLNVNHWSIILTLWSKQTRVLIRQLHDTIYHQE